MKKGPARRRAVFRAGKEVRKLARERVGQVKPGQVITPKTRRKGSKHPQREREEWSQ